MVIMESAAFFGILAEAGFAFPRYAKLSGTLLAEMVKRENAAAVGTDLMVLVGILAQTNHKMPSLLDNLPVESANTEPAVIQANADLDPVTNHVNDIDGVAPVIRLLDQDINPEFRLDDLEVPDGQSCFQGNSFLDGLGFLAQGNMAS